MQRQLAGQAIERLGLTGLGARGIGGEVVAGCMGSLVSIAYCVSYSALIFGGALASGLGAGLWAFLAATALATLIVALTTTLPPGIAGARNPTVAVMSVLVAGIAATATARGLGPEQAVRHALVGLAIATLLTGLALAVLGFLRLGQAVRFVPYPVIAGFLAASGWLLIVGGLEVAAAGPARTPAALLALPAEAWLRIALAAAFAAAVLLARRAGAPAAVLPVLFFGSSIALDLALPLVGVRPGWHLGGSAEAQAWSPLVLAGSGPPIDWTAILGSSVEIGAVAGVAVITLLLDVSQLEALRNQSADLDRDFRSNGIANLVVAPLGGAAVGMAPNSSRLIEEAGGSTRFAGLAGGLLVLGVLVSGLDIAALLPTPVLGGLLVLLGVGIAREALAGAPAGRSPLDLALAVAIMVTIVQVGYLPGVVLGLVAACLGFAVRYSRIGVIRRHVTRATCSAPVERASEETALLVAEGSRIHVVWLAGYVFFGSSHGLYEAIRRSVGDGGGRRRWVVLDMSAVTGLDTSALLSFAKLAAWAREERVELAVAAVSDAARAAFRDQALDGPDIRFFPTRNDALVHCEEALLDEARGPRGPDLGAEQAFAAWLAQELGAEASRSLLARYLERRELAGGELLCRQGEASDSIDLVASGAVDILLREADGRVVRVRRVFGRTVVGEMGFFRRQPRVASVEASRPAVVWVLSRPAYERLAREAPETAARFLEFIVRQLSDRVELATREIASLV